MARPQLCCFLFFHLCLAHSLFQWYRPQFLSYDDAHWHTTRSHEYAVVQIYEVFILTLTLKLLTLVATEGVISIRVIY